MKTRHQPHIAFAEYDDHVARLTIAAQTPEATAFVAPDQPTELYRQPFGQYLQSTGNMACRAALLYALQPLPHLNAVEFAKKEQDSQGRSLTRLEAIHTGVMNILDVLAIDRELREGRLRAMYNLGVQTCLLGSVLEEVEASAREVSGCANALTITKTVRAQTLDPKQRRHDMHATMTIPKSGRDTALAFTTWETGTDMLDGTTSSLSIAVEVSPDTAGLAFGITHQGPEHIDGDPVMSTLQQAHALTKILHSRPVHQ